MKFCFVILHYNNIEDTINCIDSINNLVVNSKIETDIVIVDNKSPNGSGTELQNKYKGQKNIVVELLDENIGFSRGNNAGYKIAKERKADCILVINNDIIFEDKKFLVNLYEDINENKDVYVIAPDIVNLKEQHQNPLNIESVSKKSSRKTLWVERISYCIYSIPLLRKIYYDAKKSREEKWYDNYYEDKKKNIDSSFDRTNFVPFGAFLIYTNNWIKKEEIALPSTSFMYMEEDVLYLYLRKKNYGIRYYDNLMIRHLAGQSTNKRTKNKYKNAKFQSRCKIDAHKKYLKLLKQKEI